MVLLRGFSVQHMSSCTKHPLRINLGTEVSQPINPAPPAIGLNFKPPIVACGLNPAHHTCSGILETGTFSLNLPGPELVEATDWCGLKSGKKHDKSGIFKTYTGELETAPMIEECPVNIECRVIQTMERPVHTVFIGEVVEVYFDERCLTEGVPDVSRIDPILYGPLKGRTAHSGGYWKLGEFLARAWDVGKRLREGNHD